MSKKFVSIIILIIIAFFGVYVNSNEADKYVLPKVEDIEMMQINASKIKASDMGKDRIAYFVNNLHEIINDNNRVNYELPDKEEKISDVISLISKDGTRNIFEFVKVNDEYYIEVYKDKNVKEVFKGANFIKEYIQRENISELDKVSVEIPNNALLEHESKSDIFDETFFYEEMSIYYEDIYKINKQEADKLAENYIKEIKGLYEYAINNGYELSQDEKIMLINQQKEEIESAVNYGEVVDAYAKYGLDISSSINNRQEHIEKMGTIEKMRKEKYREFCFGNDSLDGVVYQNFEDYWSKFVSTVLAQV